LALLAKIKAKRTMGLYIRILENENSIRADDLFNEEELELFMNKYDFERSDL